MTALNRGFVADIGGTNARLGIATGLDGLVEGVRVYACAEHADFAALARRYCSDTGEVLPPHACLAVAGPVDGNKVRFTNSPWGIDGDELAAVLGLAHCELVNDFAALAYALPWLQAGDLAPVGLAKPAIGDIRLVLGPGTGLGVSALIEKGGRRLALASEGGHIGFAPFDALEIELLRWFGDRYGRVSMERLLCGTGLEQLHAALGEIEGNVRPAVGAMQISERGLADAASSERETLNRFLGLLGSFAGDLALVTGAGTVFIGGGIVPRLHAVLPASPFRQRFTAKGRFSTRLAAVPTSLIIAETPALRGCAARLFDPMIMDVPADLPTGGSAAR